MNIAGLPELILSWLKNQGAEQLSSGRDQQALAQFKPGMQYEGKVLDLLPNGRNLVQVGNQAMDMSLPRQASPGEVVRLTYLNALPRPTFAISAATTAPTAPVNVSQAAQQVSALVRYAPVTPVAPVAARAVAAPVAPGTAAAAASRAAPLATAASLTASTLATATLASPATLAATPSAGTAPPAAPGAAPATTTASAPNASSAGPAAAAGPAGGGTGLTAGVAVSAREAAMLKVAQAALAGQAVGGAAPAAATPAGPTAAATLTAAAAAQPGSPAQPAAAATPARAGSAILADVLPATTVARAQAIAGAASARPIVANAALLLAPGTSGAVTATATPGPAIPALAMAGEAVDGARAALGSNPSLTTAQGVVAEKSAASNMLPMRLQQTVKESGLFYESHLGKWVRGELPLESIQREPQARLAQMPGPLVNLPDLEGMPEEAARLASRQLHMLDGTPFLWQGQAWPGQMAEWLVRERERGEGDAAEAGQKWHSSLRLTLPRLGELAADLDIGALGLRVRLRSPSPETLAEIQAALPQLVERLRAAELNLSSIRTELGDGE